MHSFLHLNVRTWSFYRHRPWLPSIAWLRSRLLPAVFHKRTRVGVQQATLHLKFDHETHLVRLNNRMWLSTAFMLHFLENPRLLFWLGSLAVTYILCSPLFPLSRNIVSSFYIAALQVCSLNRFKTKTFVMVIVASDWFNRLAFHTVLCHRSGSSVPDRHHLPCCHCLWPIILLFGWWCVYSARCALKV